MRRNGKEWRGTIQAFIMIHDHFEKVNDVRELRMDKLINSMNIESMKTMNNLRGANYSLGSYNVGPIGKKIDNISFNYVVQLSSLSFVGSWNHI